MRPRVGRGVGDPDVTVRAGPLDRTTRTLGNAVAILEMRSDDTATTDRVAKLLDAVAAILCAAEPDRDGGHPVPPRAR